MSRDWAKVHASLSSHPKWIRLSPIGRGAWSTLLLAAMPLDGRFKDRDHVIAILERDRFDNAVAVVDELVRIRLLDIDETGVEMHDWPDHQPLYRGPSDEPEAVAERKRRSRARKASHDVSRDVTSGHDRGDKSREEKNYLSRGRARDDGEISEKDEAWAAFVRPEWRQFREAWSDRGFRLPPSGDSDDAKTQRGVLWAIARDAPESLARWVAEAPGDSTYEVVSYCASKWGERIASIPDDPEPLLRAVH